MRALLPALLIAAPAMAQEAPRPIAASKIVLVGDSTTAVIGGWGPSFCAYHVTSFAACVNLARGGRSSGSYRTEGSWDLALAEMRAQGYKKIWVLIQFGHNDQPGKPGRSTDLATEFPANLARYVDETRSAGATPVLLTPLTRRSFKDGKLQNDLEPWAAAIRKVAAEKQVPLLDLNADSAAAVQAMGEAAADRFAQLPPGSAPIGPAPASATEVEVKPMATPKLSFDRTHLGVEGANYFAAMVTRELAEAIPEMRPLLVR
ncbi:rhamnogalacturonan acetylesterase [Sphingomonas sp. LM7]|uniref:rhamnogalacturonan acetylesterase n=1 Tax=Sphingomonas sp. LM7 TaxID=1938607 RepID=UPI0009839D51|nr:rhamnogalacturonan acetylesterase [Sphingomonas sp. LM7]AQR75233.1 lysophospholipase [Sphingomonas sp. LM7]